MKATVGSIFANVPGDLPEELTEVLISAREVTLERIVSRGHASPPGFWYEDERAECVLLLSGSAALRFEDEPAARELSPGDWVNIPARARHRVERTEPGKDTVWLALYYRLPA